MSETEVKICSKCHTKALTDEEVKNGMSICNNCAQEIIKEKQNMIKSGILGAVGGFCIFSKSKKAKSLLKPAVPYIKKIPGIIIKLIK